MSEFYQGPEFQIDSLPSRSSVKYLHSSMVHLAVQDFTDHIRSRFKDCMHDVAFVSIADGGSYFTHEVMSRLYDQGFHDIFSTSITIKTYSATQATYEVDTSLKSFLLSRRNMMSPTQIILLDDIYETGNTLDAAELLIRKTRDRLICEIGEDVPRSKLNVSSYVLTRKVSHGDYDAPDYLSGSLLNFRLPKGRIPKDYWLHGCGMDDNHGRNRHSPDIHVIQR